MLSDTCQIAASRVSWLLAEVTPSTSHENAPAHPAPIDPQLSALLKAFKELQVHQFDQRGRPDGANEAPLWKDLGAQLQPAQLPSDEFSECETRVLGPADVGRVPTERFERCPFGIVPR